MTLSSFCVCLLRYKMGVMGMEFFLGVLKMSLNEKVVMVAQLCEYPKNH